VVRHHCIEFLYMTIINPFVVTNKNSLSSYQYRWAVEEELNNPEYSPYINKSLNELSEPEYQDSEGSKGCYHIYNYRKYHNPTKTPYTKEVLDNDFTWQLWSEIFIFSGIGAVGSALVSLAVYWTGLVFAWVLIGFRKQ
jgi:hypothetical protein